MPGLERISQCNTVCKPKIPSLFSRYDNAVDLLNEKQPQAKEALASLADFSENKLPDVEKDLKKANKIFKKLDKDDAVDKLIDTLKNDLKKQADIVANPINKNDRCVPSKRLWFWYDAILYCIVYLGWRIING